MHVALPWLFWSLVAVLSLQLGVSLSTEERILVSWRYTTGNALRAGFVPEKFILDLVKWG